MEIVRRIAAELISNELISDSVPLMDMGIDSLSATEIASNLSTEFGLKLFPTLLFNYPTVNDIVNHLCNTMSLTEDNKTEIILKVTGGVDDNVAI